MCLRRRGRTRSRRRGRGSDEHEEPGLVGRGRYGRRGPGRSSSSRCRRGSPGAAWVRSRSPSSGRRRSPTQAVVSKPARGRRPRAGGRGRADPPGRPPRAGPEGQPVVGVLGTEGMEDGHAVSSDGGSAGTGSARPPAGTRATANSSAGALLGGEPRPGPGLLLPDLRACGASTTSPWVALAGGDQSRTGSLTGREGVEGEATSFAVKVWVTSVWQNR
jgi:hypothetical protein